MYAVRKTCLRRIRFPLDPPLGDRERRRVLETIAGVMGQSAQPLDILGATKHGDLAILMPESTVREAADRLRAMATQAASMVTQAQGLNIRPVPMIGFVEFESNRVENNETVFARAAERYGNEPALQIRRGGRWLRYTYAEALSSTGTILLRLQELGLIPGDRVAICAENGPEWGLTYMAVMRGGMTAVPLDPQLPPSEALAAARGNPVVTVLPRVVQTPAGPALRIPAEADYGVTELLVSEAS